MDNGVSEIGTVGIVLVGIMLVGTVPVGIAPVGIGTCTQPIKPNKFRVHLVHLKMLLSNNRCTIKY